MMDPVLKCSADIIQQVANCIEIALRCTQHDQWLRPSMKQVVMMLGQNQGHVKREIGVPGTYIYEGLLFILETST